MLASPRVSAIAQGLSAAMASGQATDVTTQPRCTGRRRLHRVDGGKWISAIGILVTLWVTQPSDARAESFGSNDASDTGDPCDGLFAVMDRPTIADSSCSVKPGRLLAELGYTNAAIKGSDTRRAANFPQAALRYGFAEGWEFRLFPPIYNSTDRRGFPGGHLNGLGDTAFGAKYQIGTFGGVTVATDAKLTVPSGTEDFSGGGVQGNVQTVISYGLTPTLGVTLQLSGSSLTERAGNGRPDRYRSFGANIVVGYQLNDTFNLFSELYGNSASGPRSRGDLSYLGGVQILLTRSIEFDIGAGTLLRGPQGQQARFIQIGTGLYF